MTSILLHCLLCVLVYSATFFSRSHGIYIPGVMPNEFKIGDQLEVKAVKLTSSKTQLPYRYYELDFCEPTKKIEYVAENIGEILRGDRLVNTPYEIRMGKNLRCMVLCEKDPLSKQSASAMQSFISEDYLVHLSIDNLMGATVSKLDDRGDKKHYIYGFRLGINVAGVNYIHNHLRFKLQYNTVDSDKHRFVGFELEPLSISEEALKVEEGACELPSEPIPMAKWKSITDDTQKLIFSYDVVWEPSTIRWASRWDIYLRSEGGQVHWFSLLNSLVVILFLTAVISFILVRTLRKDIARYNRVDDAEDILEESGWKLVHGDVFRPPRRVRLLTAMIGSGVQIFSMMFFTIFFAMLGMLSPASRGALMTAAIFTYVFMGLVAGYYAGRFYKTMRGTLWKSTAMLTGFLFPTLLLVIGSVLNSFVWYKRSSAAVPFTTMLVILTLWLGISLPLVFVGFFFGFRKRPYELPVRTNQIPRAVPAAKFHQGLVVTTLLAGMLPFGSVFIELFFVYNALWEGHFYYLFGFLFAVFIVMVVSCAQVAIIVTYLQLCNEDYRWWWRTFIVSGGPAVYMGLYSIFYYWRQLEISQFVPTVVYFGYTTLMVLTFWILTGTIGFVATFIFLRYIYAAIKID